jgi:hypothetical protein
MSSDEWDFYAGVQRAARDALHAELQAVHGDAPAWLDHERPPFREGYLRTSAMLSAASTASEPPRRLSIPSPP